MDTLYTFWDNITLKDNHYKTKRVDVLGLMNSATNFKRVMLGSKTLEVPNVRSSMKTRVITICPTALV